MPNYYTSPESIGGVTTDSIRQAPPLGATETFTFGSPFVTDAVWRISDDLDGLRISALEDGIRHVHLGVTEYVETTSVRTITLMSLRTHERVKDDGSTETYEELLTLQESVAMPDPDIPVGSSGDMQNQPSMILDFSAPLPEYNFHLGYEWEGATWKDEFFLVVQGSKGSFEYSKGPAYGIDAPNDGRALLVIGDPTGQRSLMWGHWLETFTENGEVEAPPPPAFTVTPIDATEGESAPAGFTITLSHIPTQPHTLDVSASSPNDSQADVALQSVAVVFAPGEISKTVYFDVIDDKLPERTESVEFLIGGNTGAGVTAAFKIYDNDVSGPPDSWAGTISKVKGAQNELVQALYKLERLKTADTDILSGTAAALGKFAATLKAASIILDTGVILARFAEDIEVGNPNKFRDLMVNSTDTLLATIWTTIAPAAATAALVALGATALPAAAAAIVVSVAADEVYRSYWQEYARAWAVETYEGIDLSVEQLVKPLSLNGSPEDDLLIGAHGNDVFYASAGSDNILGGEGVDRFILDSRANENTVTILADQLVINDSDTLVDVERVTFADGSLAFDINGAAGQTLRLYQAALGRDPDAAGLGHNIAHLDQGMTHKEMANAFIGSLEFQQRFGAQDSEHFVQLLYQNILGREGEPDGVEHHVNLLDSGFDRADLLVGFSEGQENLNRTAPLTSDGIWFT